MRLVWCMGDRLFHRVWAWWSCILSRFVRVSHQPGSYWSRKMMRMWLQWGSHTTVSTALWWAFLIDVIWPEAELRQSWSGRRKGDSHCFDTLSPWRTFLQHEASQTERQQLQKHLHWHLWSSNCLWWIVHLYGMAARWHNLIQAITRESTILAPAVVGLGEFVLRIQISPNKWDDITHDCYVPAFPPPSLFPTPDDWLDTAQASQHK